MKILVLCVFGENRSRYLAQYLSSKGFDADYDGIANDDKKAIQQKIDHADTVIAVNGEVRERWRLILM